MELIFGILGTVVLMILIVKFAVWLFEGPVEKPKESAPELPDLCFDMGAHDDDILKNETLPSHFEQMTEVERRFCEAEWAKSNANDRQESYGKGTGERAWTYYRDYFIKTLMITVRCKKCGRVKTIKETNE